MSQHSSMACTACTVILHVSVGEIQEGGEKVTGRAPKRRRIRTRSLGFYTACVSHVGRGQSALLAHASTQVLPHLAGTATQAHTWWFADTTKLAELAELAEPAELASRTGRTE
jgi:hypothetical protein